MTQLFSSTHHRLVACLAEHIADPRVIDAIRAVPRPLFVQDDVHIAGANGLTPTAASEPAQAPLLVARTCEVLQLSGRERLLDIGTGLGYRAAVLAGLADEVVTVGVASDRAPHVREALRRTGITNVDIVVGDRDPVSVAAERGPFDVIVLAGPTGRRTERRLADELAESGRLVVPTATGRRLLVTLRRDGQRPVRLVPVARCVRVR
jgi:protein-L-isoaspartate(D-aspartate) O-methyltransferase